MLPVRTPLPDINSESLSIDAEEPDLASLIQQVLPTGLGCIRSHRQMVSWIVVSIINCFGATKIRSRESRFSICTGSISSQGEL
jgi:hypothetical protein